MTQPTEDFFFSRPQTNQTIAVGKRVLPSPVEKIFNDVPKIGLVISTFGAPAYVDLALAVRNRLYPQIPVLVHDDASDQGEDLDRICRQNGAVFESNSSRLGHEMGDLSAVVGGLGWAKEHGLDLLVKMSRRFVPQVGWVGSLEKLAMLTQFGTFGQACVSYRLPLRTECFAMAVSLWSQESVTGGITEFMLKNRQSIFVENYLLGYAGKVHGMLCVTGRAWEAQNVKSSPGPVYAKWDFVGPGRAQSVPHQLWHETASPAQYAELGNRLGLKYTAEAFGGVNSRAGF